MYNFIEEVRYKSRPWYGHVLFTISYKDNTDVVRTIQVQFISRNWTVARTVANEIAEEKKNKLQVIIEHEDQTMKFNGYHWPKPNEPIGKLTQDVSDYLVKVIGKPQRVDISKIECFEAFDKGNYMETMSEVDISSMTNLLPKPDTSTMSVRDRNKTNKFYDVAKRYSQATSAYIQLGQNNKNATEAKEAAFYLTPERKKTIPYIQKHRPSLSSITQTF